MSIRPRHLFWLIAWAAVAYGVALLGTLPDEVFGDLGHKLCGPWG
jgi:hypothetical protein